MIVAALVVAVSACGGAQKATPKEMSDQAKKAPPPPDKVTPGKKIDRKVSKEAAGDFKQAVAFYETAAADGWTADECKSAAGKFESLAESGDKLVEAWYNAGVCYSHCLMTKDAERSYQNALKINNSHAGSLANLGEIYLRGGNVETAQKYFEKALEADGTTVAAYVNIGWINYQRVLQSTSNEDKDKFVAQAKKYLQLALAVDNQNVVARVTMALVYIEGARTNKNQLELANLILDKVVKCKPVEPEEPKYEEFKNEKLKEKAKQAYEEAVRKYKVDVKRHEQALIYPGLYHAYGLIAIRRNNVGKALADFRKVLTLDPNYVEAHMNVASLVIGFRKYGETPGGNPDEHSAEWHYRKVLELQPKNYDATIGLGVALRGQFKMEEAEVQYKRAIELDPARADAYFDMGLLWKTRVNPKENSIAAYEQSIANAKVMKEYFAKYLAKAGAKATKENKDKAEENIKEADEAVKEYTEVIKEEQKRIEEEKRNPPQPPADQPPAEGQPPAGENKK
jgi:tetratricopeptide (TPR) repeat protein